MANAGILTIMPTTVRGMTATGTVVHGSVRRTMKRMMEEEEEEEEEEE